METDYTYPDYSNDPTGDYDVYYEYTHYLGNGDSLTGYGFANASDGYYTGQTITPVYDETYSQTYQAGYYQINYTYNTNYDYGVEGYVQVNQYWDAETGSNASYLYDSTFTYNYGVGYSGLGSESGYAYNGDFTNSDPLYGYQNNQYYEAELTASYAPPTYSYY